MRINYRTRKPIPAKLEECAIGETLLITQETPVGKLTKGDIITIRSKETFAARIVTKTGENLIINIENLTKYFSRYEDKV